MTPTNLYFLDLALNAALTIGTLYAILLLVPEKFIIQYNQQKQINGCIEITKNLFKYLFCTTVLFIFRKEITAGLNYTLAFIGNLRQEEASTISSGTYFAWQFLVVLIHLIFMIIKIIRKHKKANIQLH